MSDPLARNLTARVHEMLSTFRLVMIGGARQVGKTTLAEDLLSLPSDNKFTLDDEATLTSAVNDSMGFVYGLPKPAVIDEFQRAGQALLLAVKHRVDRDRTPGQLLLTGSANYLADRSVSETLAGRVGRLILWPLSAGERRGIRETFVDNLFEPTAWPAPPGDGLSRLDVSQWIIQGGYPQIVLDGLGPRARRDWFTIYTQDVISREALRPMVEVRLEDDLRRVFALLAARTSQELVVTDVAADAGLHRDTVANYVALLQALYLVVLVPAWATSPTTRAKRRPKVLLTDTGLAAYMCGVSEADLRPTSPGPMAGPLFETLVAGEIFKQSAWSERSVNITHFRDRAGPEVDLIVEEWGTGRIAAVEVKLTSTPLPKHAQHLAYLRDRLGERFAVGLVVHTGNQSLPLGERLWAVPVSALWRDDRA